jgi:hypothetical protein
MTYPVAHPYDHTNKKGTGMTPKEHTAKGTPTPKSRLAKPKRLLGLAAVMSIAVAASLAASTSVAFAESASTICIPEAALKTVTTALEGKCEAKAQAVQIPPPAEMTILNNILPHIKYQAEGIDKKPTIQFSAANVQIINGEGKTSTINGEGNLIIGYDEGIGTQTGSHDLILGIGQEYTSYGSILAGNDNKALAEGASVTGGTDNTASNTDASVTGGEHNTASGCEASVSGGSHNTANHCSASVGGGYSNTAARPYASVDGGRSNTASGEWSAITGGNENKATGFYASVLGGFKNLAEGEWSAIYGGKEVTASKEYEAIG